MQERFEQRVQIWMRVLLPSSTLWGKFPVTYSVHSCNFDVNNLQNMMTQFAADNFDNHWPKIRGKEKIKSLLNYHRKIRSRQMRVCVRIVVWPEIFFFRLFTLLLHAQNFLLAKTKEEEGCHRLFRAIYHEWSAGKKVFKRPAPLWNDNSDMVNSEKIS